MSAPFGLPRKATRSVLLNRLGEMAIRNQQLLDEAALARAEARRSEQNRLSAQDWFESERRMVVRLMEENRKLQERLYVALDVLNETRAPKPGPMSATCNTASE